jgi:hypothetical protein
MSQNMCACPLQLLQVDPPPLPSSQTDLNFYAFVIGQLITSKRILTRQCIVTDAIAKFTVPQLKDELTIRGVEFANKMKKGALQNLLGKNRIIILYAISLSFLYCLFSFS